MPSKRWLVFILLVVNSVASSNEIALTFDDAPLSGSALMSGSVKTDKIIKQLESRTVKDALFFVTTQNISNQRDLERLQRYSRAGFKLANHSHSHQSTQKTTPEEYLHDFYTSHLISKDFGTYIKLHRYPYLHRPNKLKDREKIYRGIKDKGYEIGYVTVDNYDWYLNSKLVKAHEQGLAINMDNLRRLYVDTLWSAIKHYDELAKKSLNRSPKHVLLLHENELAALFIGDLVDHIRSQGWRIISSEAAYEDPIAKISDASLEFTGQGRVAAIAHSKGFKKQELRHPSESTEYLDKKLEEYDVFREKEIAVYGAIFL